MPHVQCTLAAQDATRTLYIAANLSELLYTTSVCLSSISSSNLLSWWMLSVVEAPCRTGSCFFLCCGVSSCWPFFWWVGQGQTAVLHGLHDAVAFAAVGLFGNLLSFKNVFFVEGTHVNIYH